MSDYPHYAICLSNQAIIGMGEKGELVAAGPDDRNSLLLTVGRRYKILGERLGMYIVVDDTGSTSLHPKPHFRRTSEPSQ